VEFYDDSPATKYFRDVSIVLSGGREQDAVTREWSFTERIFYANYCFSDKSISLAIFDDVTRNYVLDTVYLQDYSEAAELLQVIAGDYPGKINVKGTLSQWKVYFTAMKEGDFIESPVSDIDGSCGQCGDYNRDEFIFLYVPAVPGTDLDEASLGIHWDYGCFGGNKVTGVYDEVVEEVTEVLTRLEEVAKGKYKSAPKEALELLSKLAAVPSK
jgi:hypothetical protein